MRVLIWVVFCLTILQVQSNCQCLLSCSGTLQHAATGEPISGATISIPALRKAVLSDAMGRFRFDGLCMGELMLRIECIGYEKKELHLHLMGNWDAPVLLRHQADTLAAVVVTGKSRLAASSATVSLQGIALEAAKGGSLGELMKQMTGVTVLQTGTNIFKPVIHGLHSNRVLILNNGIRQEGQQWGNEHAPEIDPYLASRITVIKDAGALRYGGDAIGGVVLVEPRPLPSVQELRGELNLAGFTNSRMGVLSLQTEGSPAQHPGFSWRIQGTIRRGGNARTPGYFLENSATSELNYSAAAGWRKAGKGMELFYSSFSTKLSIFSGSHIGNTTDLLTAINSGEPPDNIRNAGFSYTIDRPYQNVQHQLVKWKGYVQPNSHSRFNLTVSGQWNHRREYDKKRFQSSENTPQLDLQIGTLSVEGLYEHFGKGLLRGMGGWNTTYQQNSYQYRLFIPNYEAFQAGAFWTEKAEIRNWVFDAGLRFDYRGFFNTSQNNGKPYPERNYKNLSASSGIQYRFTNKWQVAFNFSNAWRAPQVNELYTDGLHHGAARIEKGDSLLNPERALNLQFSLEHSSSSHSLEITLYRKNINGFIFLKPTYPPQLTIRGAFPAFVFNQTDALLQGIDFSMRQLLSAHWKLEGKATLLWARDQIADDWLIQMPPNRYEVSVQYQFPDATHFSDNYLKLVSTFVEKQRRVPQTGNIEITRTDGSKYMASDYAPPPAAYNLFQLEAGSLLRLGRQELQVFLTISNLMNTRYRDYMNAFRYFSDEMGRNAALRIKIPFEPISKSSKQTHTHS